MSFNLIPVRYILHIFLIFTPISSRFRFYHQNHAGIFLLSHACHIPCPSHPPCFHHLSSNAHDAQIMQFLIKQFSPASSCFVLLRFKYFLGTLSLNTHSHCSSFHVRCQVYHPYKARAKLKSCRIWRVWMSLLLHLQGRNVEVLLIVNNKIAHLFTKINFLCHWYLTSNLISCMCSVTVQLYSIYQSFVSNQPDLFAAR